MKQKLIKVIRKIGKFLWLILGYIYYVIYALSWLLHKVARLLLAISYFGMLNKRMAKDILKSLIVGYGKY